MIRLSFFVLHIEIIHRIHIVIHSVTCVIFPLDCLVRSDVIPANVILHVASTLHFMMQKYKSSKHITCLELTPKHVYNQESQKRSTRLATVSTLTVSKRSHSLGNILR